MRFFILVVCLLKLQAEVSAEVFNGEYESIYYPLTIPDSHEGFDDDVKLVERPGRMINAYRATNGQYPWSTRLTIQTPVGNYACTGSIISEDYTLSAYHCVNAEVIIAVQFSLGSIDRNSEIMQQHFSSGFWYIEPTTESRPDIALFKLFETLVLNPNIQPIALPSLKNVEFSYEGWASTIMGFGLGDNGSLSRYLQYGHYMLMRNDECNFADYEICALASPNSEISTQGGDSGGPWIVYENNVPTLVGIHWGRRFNSTTNMHRATRVSMFLGFISENSGLKF